MIINYANIFNVLVDKAEGQVTQFVFSFRLKPLKIPMV